MLGLKVGNQCLFGSVSLATLPAPVPLLLPTGFQVKVLHGSEGKNLAAVSPQCEFSYDALGSWCS